MVSRINREIAERLLNEIRIHNTNPGGTMAGIIGSKGSGKTHFLVRLAHQVLYLHPATDTPTRETVIWRGRTLDYWSWMYLPDFEWEEPADAFRRQVYIHYHVDDTPTFIDELGTPIQFPPDALRTYNRPIDLRENLVVGEINIIYEPTRYDMSRAMHDLLLARSCSRKGAMDGIEYDPALWWVEFLFFLLQFKKAGFVTVFIDEADEVFPANPSGIRWHLQGLFCDAAKDFRKANISFVFSIHDYADLDYRLRSKTQYYGYMRGARPKTGSMVKRTTSLLLPVGDIIIERDGYGTTNLGKLTERPRVRTLFLSGAGDLAAWGESASDSLADDDDTLTCTRCGHTWIPRTFAPQRCPNCNAFLMYEEIEEENPFNAVLGDSAL